MDSTQDKINGAVNTAAGSIKKAVGNVIGSEKLKAEADAQTVKGETQKTSGKVKDAIQQGFHAAGDAIEMAGKKLESAGLKTIGEVIHNAGDKLEHMAD